MEEKSTVERRANIRLHRVLAVEFEHEGEFLPAIAVDLSVTGFQVATHYLIPAGVELRARLHLSHGPRVDLTARVVWTCPLELNLYRIGVEIEELDSVEAFEAVYNYVEKERLTGEALEDVPATLELGTQLALRSMSPNDLDRFEVLAQITDLLHGSYQLEEVMVRALKVMVEATGAERGLLLLDRGEGRLEVPAFHSLTRNASQEFSRSVVQRVLGSGQAVVSLDARKDERFERSSSLRVLGTRSVLCVPVGDYGSIYLDSSVRAGVFTQSDLRLGLAIAKLAAGAIQRSEDFKNLVQTEKMAAVGTMLAGILHELRNPLGSIMMIGEALHQEMASEMTDDLLCEAQRCRNLVIDLLRMTRREPYERVPVDLSTVVGVALSAVKPSIEKAKVSLVADLPRLAPSILGNADHLRQVVLNLLSNAIFEASDRPQGRVSVSLYSTQTKVVLKVEDNGDGIPAENFRKLFTPFFTTKDAGQGTGLGLSVVERIVSEHGGCIRAANAPQGGAVFTVELPLAPARLEEIRQLPGHP